MKKEERERRKTKERKREKVKKRAVQSEEKGLQTKVKRVQRRRRSKGKPNKAMGRKPKG